MSMLPSGETVASGNGHETAGRVKYIPYTRAETRPGRRESWRLLPRTGFRRRTKAARVVAASVEVQGERKTKVVASSRSRPPGRRFRGWSGGDGGPGAGLNGRRTRRGLSRGLPQTPKPDPVRLPPACPRI
jgi:hypothetical protein